MSKFEITPFAGTGEISFDMPRDSVRKLAGQYKEFKKTKFSKNTADDFNGFHVYYDTDNKVEAVEFFGGLELEYQGNNLLVMNYNALSHFIKVNSFTCKELDTDTIIISDIGISVYIPGKSVIESILVYRRGYYDFLNQRVK